MTKVSPLASDDPADIAWRTQQGYVDAAIEGNERDPVLAAFVDKMRADGVPIEERIERLKALAMQPSSI